jgi:hypothetical protein
VSWLFKKCWYKMCFDLAIVSNFRTMLAKMCFKGRPICATFWIPSYEILKLNINNITRLSVYIGINVNRKISPVNRRFHSRITIPIITAHAHLLELHLWSTSSMVPFNNWCWILYFRRICDLIGETVNFKNCLK